MDSLTERKGVFVPREVTERLKAGRDEAEAKRAAAIARAERIEAALKGLMSCVALTKYNAEVSSGFYDACYEALDALKENE